LNILFFTEVPSKGVFSVLKDLAEYGLKKKCKITILYSPIRTSARFYKFKLNIIEEYKNIKFEEINIRTALGFADLLVLTKLYKFFYDNNFDIIHSHSSKAGGLMRLLAFLMPSLRKKIIYSPHAYFGMSGDKSLKVYLYNFIEKILKENGKTITVCNNEYLFSKNVLKISSDKVININNFVNTDRFVPRKFKRGNCFPLLGAVARFSDQKDPFTLYKALVKAQDQVKFRFVHLGEGELLADIKKAYPKYFESKLFAVKEFDPKPEDFYKSLDGFVHCMKYEGMSLAPLEAMSCALPICYVDTFDEDPFKDIEFDFALRSDKFDVDGLTKNIVKLVKFIKSKKENHNRDKIIESFSAKNQVPKYFELYESIFKKK